MINYANMLSIVPDFPFTFCVFCVFLGVLDKEIQFMNWHSIYPEKMAICVVTILFQPSQESVHVGYSVP